MFATKQSQLNLQPATSFIYQIPIKNSYQNFTRSPKLHKYFHTYRASFRRPRAKSLHQFQNQYYIYDSNSLYQYKTKQTVSSLAQITDTEVDSSQPTDEDTDVEIFHATCSEEGMRLDKILASRFDARSRTYYQNLLSAGCVQVEGKTIKQKSKRILKGEQIAVKFLPLEREMNIEPEPIPLSILYEDDYIAIIDKKAGMVVHPAPGHWQGTLVHALCYRYTELAKSSDSRAGIIHRLDKDTSGVIITGKTMQAVAAMSELFAKREIEKEYITITVGNPAGKGCEGRLINASIGRSRVDRLRMDVIAKEAGGKEAFSKVEVIAHDSSGLLHVCRVGIESGRTHQIRVHMRHMKTPVLGDELYGNIQMNSKFLSIAPRVMLHAHRLSFQHPFLKSKINIHAKLPEDFRRLLHNVVYPNFEQEQVEW